MMNQERQRARRDILSDGIAWAGHAALGLFVFSVPVLYMSASLSLEWLVQPLGILAIVANLPNFRWRGLHPAMLCLGALWLYFAVTAFDSDQAYVSDFFMVYGKFTALAIVLSLQMRTRAQSTVVLAALAVSVVVVAYISREQLLSAGAAAARVAASRIGEARTAGVFANSNQLGTYAALAGVAALTLLARATSRLLWPLIGGAVLCAAQLALFSGSRKAVLGMAFVCGYAAWEVMQLNRRRRGIILSLAVAGGIVAGGLIWWRANPFIARFSTEDASFVARADLLRGSWEMWAKAPLLGSGYRAFELTDVSGLYTHSTPMEMLVSGGVVALLLYLVLFVSGFISFRRCLAAERDPRERMVLVGLGCLWTMLFMFSLFTVILEEKIFLVTAGCLAGILGRQEADIRRRRQARRTLASPAERQPCVLSSKYRP